MSNAPRIIESATGELYRVSYVGPTAGGRGSGFRVRPVALSAPTTRAGRGAFVPFDYAARDPFVAAVIRYESGEGELS